MDLVLASNNQHKIFEFKHKFETLNLNINLLSLSDITNENIEIDETEPTLEGNAKLKSRLIFNRFKICSIADDTGLEVLELNNEPGVYSARYSGEHGNDGKNRQKLLHKLINIENRKARFRTVICFSDNSNDYLIEGICDGKISKEEVGINGFGYDSLFIPDGFDNTFAEMDIEIKNKISHRAKAINNFIDFIKHYSS